MALITIEVCGPKSENLLFKPINAMLAGQVKVKSDEVLSRSRVMNCPELPGQCIQIDTSAASARIFHPITDGELMELTRAERAGGVGEGKLYRPIAEKRYNNIDVATWLYWMKRAVDGGLARTVNKAGRRPEAVAKWPDTKEEPVRYFHGRKPEKEYPPAYVAPVPQPV